MFEGRKVLWVAGGRDYTDRKAMIDRLRWAVLAGGYEVLVTGAARGADLLAEEVWRKSQMPYVGVPAEWDRYSNSAGPIRNRSIAALGPNALLAFPGGRGTADALDAAVKYNVEVLDV